MANESMYTNILEVARSELPTATRVDARSCGRGCCGQQIDVIDILRGADRQTAERTATEHEEEPA